MHFYQFHIGDYQSDTRHLELMEDLAYRRMLDLYYKSENPLPLDEQEIARLIGMRSHCDCIAVVLQDFFERTEDGWRNNKCDEVLVQAYSKSEKARRSAKARWAKKSEGKQPVNANAQRTQSEGNANGMLPITQYPLPSTHYPKDQNTTPAPANAAARFYLPTTKYSTEGETFPITDDQIGRWRQNYPAVDIEGEIRKMIGWLEANPTKRKTMKGMLRFVNGWLAKQQDRGGSQSGLSPGQISPQKKGREQVRVSLRDISNTDW